MRSFFASVIVFAATVLLFSTGHAALYGVSMKGLQFLPNDLTIDRGDTVTWLNEDSTGHDVVSGTSGTPDGTWDSKDTFHRLMFKNEQFSFKFNSPGTYPYYCTPHWQTFGMVGTITVRAASTIPVVTITAPDFDQSFPPNSAVTIAANATDDDGIAKVEFFLNGTLIGSDTNAPYSFTTAPLGVGAYSLEVKATDIFGSVGSNGSDFTVAGSMPSITMSPQSQTVLTGSVVNLTIVATGTDPLSYQWAFKNVNIPGATNTSLTLTDVKTNQSGVYRVRVSNSYGFADASATLTVAAIVKPTITKQPRSQTVAVGANTSFSLGVIGAQPLRYQWFFNNHKITAGTNSFVSLKNVSTANAGTYFAVVSNAFGQATSAVVRLSVVTCNYSISAPGSTFSSAGGKGSFTITSGSECPWQIVNTNTWITLIGSSGGVGTRAITFLVATNSSRSVRSGNLLAGGKVYNIKQAGAGMNNGTDFDLNGSPDFLFETGAGRLVLWQMSRANFIRSINYGAAPADTNWQSVATMDLNNDGMPDVLWQNTDGSISAWLARVLNGPVKISIKSPAANSLWRVAAVADLNADNKPDFIFRHRDGYLSAWRMNGTNFVSQSLLFDGELVPREWRIAGAVDLSGDAKPDFLWQHTDGAIVLWTMTGGTPTRSTSIIGPAIPTGAKIQGLADVNGDGKNDFIWRKANGTLFAWLMNGTNFLRATTVAGTNSVPGDWKLIAPRN